MDGAYRVSVEEPGQPSIAGDAGYVMRWFLSFRSILGIVLSAWRVLTRPRTAFCCCQIALFVLVFPAASKAVPFDNIYVLGDSLSDQGNISIATLSTVPDPTHYFQGRFSNGPVYTDLLSQQLGLPLGPSLLGGNNFAFGGARTTYNIAENFLPPGLFPWSLNAETGAFANRGIHDANGLYIVFSGSNDIGDIPGLGLDPATVFSTLLNGVEMAIQAFKDAGAQTILVPNVPDLGLTPEALSGGISQTATALSAQYNDLLHDALLAEMTGGVNIIEFDTFGWLQKVVAHPGAFGLSNVSSPCYTGFLFFDPNATECANPKDYLFWDREHPSAAGQALLAKKMLAAVSPQSVPEPSSISLVLMGLIAVAGARQLAQRVSAEKRKAR